MRFKGFMSVLLGTSVLFVSGCGSSRQVTSERLQVTAYSLQDSVKEEVMVAVHDTIRETTTITIRENERGDTLRVSTVTDRERGRSRYDIATSRTKTEIRVDTVFIEKRDTIEIRSRPEGQSGKTTLNTTLKWVFWIIVAIGGLIIIVWVALRLKI